MTSTEEDIMVFPGITGPAAQIATVATYVQGQTGSIRFGLESATGTLSNDYLKMLQAKQGGTVYAECDRHFVPFVLARESIFAFLGDFTDAVAARLPERLRELVGSLAELFIGSGPLSLKIRIPLQIECEVFSLSYYNNDGKDTTEVQIRSARVTHDTQTAIVNQWQEPGELTVRAVANLRKGAPYVRFDWNLATAGRRLRSQASQTTGSVTLSVSAKAREGDVAVSGESGATAVLLGDRSRTKETVDLAEITSPESTGTARKQAQRARIKAAMEADMSGHALEAVRKHLKARYGVRLADAVAQSAVDEAFRVYKPEEWLLFLARQMGRTTFRTVYPGLITKARIEPSDKAVAELATRIEGVLEKQFGGYVQQSLTSRTASKPIETRRRVAAQAADVYIRRLGRESRTLTTDITTATDKGPVHGEVLAAFDRRHRRLDSTARSGAAEVSGLLAGIPHGEALSDLVVPASTDGLPPGQATFLHTIDIATEADGRRDPFATVTIRELRAGFGALARALATARGAQPVADPTAAPTTLASNGSVTTEQSTRGGKTVRKKYTRTED